MEFLHSNYPPAKTSCRSFADAFYDLLPGTETLDIAVGYITADSLIEIQKLVEFNDLRTLNLTIGMHYLDRFTKTEYNAAVDLNNYLLEKERGEVRLVTPFRYHGKLYSYSNASGPYAAIIGSNNLSSITGGGTRVYESSILLDDQRLATEMNGFIRQLVDSSTENIADLTIEQFNEQNPLLQGHENVKKVDTRELMECIEAKTEITFDIPIKGYDVSPQSNLNVFFGKGRESKNGLVKPRHWYEVELIVPKNVAMQSGYPVAKTPDAEFDVITDDGWSFRCKVSGTNNKNFRSEGDLKILGKWLKGRLENAGVLKVGDPVTQETLTKYGRNTFSLTKTKIPGLWFLDFGVKK